MQLRILTLFALILLTVTLNAEGPCHTCSKKNNDEWQFIGRYALQPEGMSPWCASSFLFEAGSRHVRGSGTLGFELDDEDRFKVTGEWLLERTSCGLSSKDFEWINQGAVGVAYQHLFCNPYILSLDIGGSYSHANSKQLKNVFCTTQSLLKQYIAGSNAYDVNFGSTLKSFNGGLVSLYATYDLVNYAKKFHSARHVSGFGGGARIFQPLFNDVDFTGLVELKQPYNYYEADLDWKNTLFSCDFAIGVFAAYTDGKRHLTNDGKVGIGLSLLLGGDGRGNKSSREIRQTPCDFDAWVRVPAVYRPKVLAIRDLECVTTCTCPGVIAPVLDAIVFAGEVSHVEGADIFFGSELGYDLSGNVPFGVTIDQTTGIMTISSALEPGEYNFRIRAHNLCGSASAAVVLTVLDTN